MRLNKLASQGEWMSENVMFGFQNSTPNVGIEARRRQTLFADLYI